MARIRAETRYLLITCADPDDGQFRGVSDACRLLVRTPGVLHLDRRGGRPLPSGAPVAPRWVVVSGHGAEDDARVGNGRDSGLRPEDLELAPETDLFLLACYQGRDPIRRKWVAGTRASVHGCEGETDSALSALFLLALFEQGPESAGHWFARWRHANDSLRVHFPQMRRLYESHLRDFGAALSAIAAIADLEPFADMVAVAKRHTLLLSGLG